jgi:signal transduction histidine kinase
MPRREELLHELSNQLTVIRGAAELVRQRVPTDDPAARDVEDVVEAADRSFELVRELRAIERSQRWPKWWARGNA